MAPLPQLGWKRFWMSLWQSSVKPETERGCSSILRTRARVFRASKGPQKAFAAVKATAAAAASLEVEAVEPVTEHTHAQLWSQHCHLPVPSTVSLATFMSTP